MTSAIKKELSIHLSQVLNTKRVNIKQYNKEIAKAEKQIANGKYTTQENLKKEVKGW